MILGGKRVAFSVQVSFKREREIGGSQRDFISRVRDDVTRRNRRSETG